MDGGRCGRLICIAVWSAIVAIGSFAVAAVPPATQAVEPAVNQVTLSMTWKSAPADEADTKPYVLRVSRAGDKTRDVWVAVKMGGTATLGVDYTAPPPVVCIPANVDHIDILMFNIDDEETEDGEYISAEVSECAAPPPLATQPVDKR